MAAILDASAGAKPLLPAHEWRIIREVAAEYSLNEEETWLLAAIRRHENGRPGLEFGIGGPMDSGHPAHRYRDGVRSFRVQARWAAGTVKKRYRGDLAAFARRYNPPNPEKWRKCVSSLVCRLKKENGSRLPGGGITRTSGSLSD